MLNQRNCPAESILLNAVQTGANRYSHTPDPNPGPDPGPLPDPNPNPFPSPQPPLPPPQPTPPTRPPIPKISGVMSRG